MSNLRPRTEPDRPTIPFQKTANLVLGVWLVVMLLVSIVHSARNYDPDATAQTCAAISAGECR